MHYTLQCSEVRYDVYALHDGTVTCRVGVRKMNIKMNWNMTSSGDGCSTMYAHSIDADLNAFH